LCSTQRKTGPPKNNVPPKEKKKIYQNKNYPIKTKTTPFRQIIPSKHNNYPFSTKNYPQKKHKKYPKKLPSKNKNYPTKTKTTPTQCSTHLFDNNTSTHPPKQNPTHKHKLPYTYSNIHPKTHTTPQNHPRKTKTTPMLLVNMHFFVFHPKKNWSTQKQCSTQRKKKNISKQKLPYQNKNYPFSTKNTIQTQQLPLFDKKLPPKKTQKIP
jgi:hypothetical protein